MMLHHMPSIQIQQEDQFSQLQSSRTKIDLSFQGKLQKLF